MAGNLCPASDHHANTLDIVNDSQRSAGHILTRISPCCERIGALRYPAKLKVTVAVLRRRRKAQIEIVETSGQVYGRVQPKIAHLQSLSRRNTAGNVEDMSSHKRNVDASKTSARADFNRPCSRRIENPRIHRRKERSWQIVRFHGVIFR